MNKKIYKKADGDLADIKDKTIAVIGYGNQGRAQALNMRDSGLNVIIGNRKDEFVKRAEEDNFSIYDISKAVEKAQIIFILIPDEIMGAVYAEEIEPNLKKNDVIVFASGYNVAFNFIQPADGLDVVLLAPRMIGVGVRENYLTGEGFYCFLAVYQDESGNAEDIVLALCNAIGGLEKGSIGISFKQEAVLDLFNEQAFGPIFGQVLLTSIKTLIDAGYPPAAVLIEMFMSGEMSYTYEKMAEVGMVKQTDFHSQTSQYGSMSRGIKYRKISRKIGEIQEEILKDIESGDFAEEWNKKWAKIKFKIIKFFATKIKFARIEKEVRKKLGLTEVDIYKDLELPDEQKIEAQKELKEELEKFKDFYRDY